MNQENEELEKTVNAKLNDIASLKVLIDAQDEHISSIVLHLNNLFDQLQETQNVCNAKILEIQSEDHFQKLMKAEQSRFRQETDQLQKTALQLREKKQNQLQTLRNLQTKADKLREELNSDHKFVNSWVEDTIMKEQNSDKLRNYINEDSVKIKKLNSQIDSLTAEELKKKQLFEDCNTNLKIARCDLDKTTASLTAIHQDCQKYIQQWEMSFQQIQFRDQEVETQLSLSLQNKEKTSKLQNDIATIEGNCKEYQTNNEELEKKVAKAAREVSKAQIEFQELEKKRSEMQKNLNSLKFSKSEGQRKLSKIQAEIEFQEKKFANGAIKLDKIKSERRELHEELYSEMSTTHSAKWQQQTLEMWLTQELKYCDVLNNEIEVKNKELFQRRKQLEGICDEEKLKKKEVEKLKSLNCGVKNTIKKLEEDLNNQNRLIQTKDKELYRLQEKLDSKENDANLSDLNNRRQMLSETIASKTMAEQTLQQDTVQQQTCINWQEKELKKWRSEKQSLSNKIEELDQEYEMAQKHLHDLNNAKQQLIVNEMLVKLEVRRLNNSRGETSASLDDIAKRRKHAEEMIIKKQISIEKESEALDKQIRFEEINKKRLLGQLAEITSKTANLRKKYEVELLPLKSWRGNEEIEPVHFLLKAEEDKTKLKLENSKLESKLQKGSMDLMTYHNTLQVLNEKNDALWKTIYRSAENSALVENIEKMEKELNVMLKKLNEKNEETNQIELNLRQRQLELGEINEKINSVSSENEDKERQLQETLAAIEEQRSKQQRAKKLIEKIKTNLPPNVYDDYVVFQLGQEQYKMYRSAIADLLNQHPEILPLVASHLEKAEFKMPKRTPLYKVNNGFSGRRMRSSATSRSSSSSSFQPSVNHSTASSSTPSIVNIEFDLNPTSASKKQK